MPGTYISPAEIGLYYLQSRYYDAKVGRFLNADVIYDFDAGLQSYNLFIYCGNNPIRRIDISGADSVDLVDGQKDEDDPLVTEGGSGRGHRSSPPPGNPSGNGNSYSNATTKWNINHYSKGQLKVGNTTVQYDGHGYYWTKDTAGHADSAYKVYTRHGKYLRWAYDADEYGNFISGKHKSEKGMVLHIG